MEAQTAMSIVVGAAGYKLLELIITFFFKRATRDDYVTRADCEDCCRQDDTTISKLTTEISAIKGILLVLAVKNEIPPEQLAKLTR